MGVNVESTQKATEDVLSKFPIELRNKVLKKGVRKAARVMANDAKGRIKGDSKRTGTRDKWSRKVKEKRQS